MGCGSSPKDLKGVAPKAKLYYRAEDLRGLEYLDSTPGEFPYTRGVRADNEWRIRAVVQDAAAAQAALDGGADEICLVLGEQNIDEVLQALPNCAVFRSRRSRGRIACGTGAAAGRGVGGLRTAGGFRARRRARTRHVETGIPPHRHSCAPPRRIGRLHRTRTGFRIGGRRGRSSPNLPIAALRRMRPPKRWHFLLPSDRIIFRRSPSCALRARCGRAPSRASGPLHRTLREWSFTRAPRTGIKQSTILM